MSKRKKIGIAALLCLFCALFLFSGYKILSSMAASKEAADAYKELKSEVRVSGVSSAAEGPAKIKKNEEVRHLPGVSAGQAKPLISVDFSALQEINPEIVGWIRSDGTNIDYPIMQTDDNSYYLTHLPNGEYNSSGAIFMDYRCKGDFSDKNTIIYGHHMRNSTMFGDLEKYKEQEYYEANPDIMLFTPEGDYLIELICGTIEDGSYEFVRFDLGNDDDFLNYMEELVSRSTFKSKVKVQMKDHIVSLCTCSYEGDNVRYMVVGRLRCIYK